jgi:hypothetical protein
MHSWVFGLGSSTAAERLALRNYELIKVVFVISFSVLHSEQVVQSGFGEWDRLHVRCLYLIHGV